MMEDCDSTDRTLTLDLWLSVVQAESAKESVRVLNPETVKGGMMSKSFVAYTVQLVLAPDHSGLNDGGSTTIETRRRFSEFEALRKILKELYVGLYIPPLTSKDRHKVENTDTFVARRQRGLQLFCDSIMRNPYTRHDSTWIAFLTPGVKIDLEKTPQELSRSPEINVGLMRWCQLVESIPAMEDENMVRNRCKDIYREARVLEGVMREHARIAKELRKLYSAQAEAYTRLTECAVQWRKLEAEVQELAGAPESTGTAAQKVPGTLQLQSGLFEGMTKATAQMPKACQHLQGSVYEFLANQAACVAGMIKLREKLVQKVSDGVQKVLTIESRKSTKSQLDELTAVRKKLDENKAKLETWSKMFLRYSVPFVVEERGRIITTIGGWTAATMIRTGTTLKSLGETYFSRNTDAGSTEAASVDSMQRSLANIGETPFGMYESMSVPKVEAHGKDNPFKYLNEGDGDLPLPPPSSVQASSGSKHAGNEGASAFSAEDVGGRGLSAGDSRDEIDDLLVTGDPPEVEGPMSPGSRGSTSAGDSVKGVKGGVGNGTSALLASLTASRDRNEDERLSDVFL